MNALLEKLTFQIESQTTLHNSDVIKLIFSIIILLVSSSAFAILPCPSAPCFTPNECESLIDSIVEGTIIEINAHDDHQELLSEMIFAPNKALKGNLPKGNLVLLPFGMCLQRTMPKQKDMQPVRLRVYIRNFEQTSYLVHFEPIESEPWLPRLEKYVSIPNPSIKRDIGLALKK